MKVWTDYRDRIVTAHMYYEKGWNVDLLESVQLPHGKVLVGPSFDRWLKRIGEAHERKIKSKLSEEADYRSRLEQEWPEEFGENVW